MPFYLQGVIMQNCNSDRYYTSSKKWWRYDPKWVVLDEVSKPESVLDIGCSYGDLGVMLKQKGCMVDGVEIYEPAYTEAKKVLNYVYKIDMDHPDLIQTEILNSYSLITLMDVLEHFKDPQSVLSACRRKLSKDGRVIISLPNVVNIRERILFFFGYFDYKEYGVLDKTHLHFYTKKTAIALMSSVFLEVRLIECTPRYDFLKRFVKFWPEMFALQFVIEGKN